MSKVKTPKAETDKMECPDCHSMILKSNFSAHKKTKRHQNAINQTTAPERVKAIQVKKSHRQQKYEEDDYISDGASDEDGDEVEDDTYPDDMSDDVTFEEEVASGFELMNNKLDQLLSLDLRKISLMMTDLTKQLNELSQLVEKNNREALNQINNVSSHIVGEMKSINKVEPFNSKTG